MAERYPKDVGCFEKYHDKFSFMFSSFIIRFIKTEYLQVWLFVVSITDTLDEAGLSEYPNSYLNWGPQLVPNVFNWPTEDSYNNRLHCMDKISSGVLISMIIFLNLLQILWNKRLLQWYSIIRLSRQFQACLFVFLRKGFERKKKHSQPTKQN